MKPPFPAVEGLYAKPTIVNNVESICNVTHIMRYGVDWYRNFGTEKSPGIRIFCLSGNVKQPGLYELPHGVSLRDLIYTYGGGPEHDDAAIKAVCPGGLSICPFGDAAVGGLQSALAQFRNEFTELIENADSAHMPVIPIRPIYRPDVGKDCGLSDSTLQPQGESLLVREHIVGRT
jgi:NADH:ubiquinone oxidoreductase subunit F (NADH-binding)